MNLNSLNVFKIVKVCLFFLFKRFYHLNPNNKYLNILIVYTTVNLICIVKVIVVTIIVRATNNIQICIIKHRASVLSRTASVKILTNFRSLCYRR